MSLSTTVSILSIFYFLSSLLFPILTNIQHFINDVNYEEQDGFILSFDKILLAEFNERLGIVPTLVAWICFFVGKNWLLWVRKAQKISPKMKLSQQ